MATIWTSYDLDMRSFDVWQGVLDSYSSTHITIRAGALAGTYRGNFSYDRYGEIYGQLHSYTATYNGETVFRVTEVNLDANRVMNYVNTENPALYTYALGGADSFDLSRYRDYVRSFGGADIVRANGGNDWLDGGVGNDRLFGGSGADLIYGGDGADRIAAGAGRDTISGGTGADLFIFGSRAEVGIGTDRDTIIDFRSGVDHIDLRAIDANLNRGDDQAFNFIGGAAFTGRAGQLRYANGVLQADMNGDGAADFGLLLGGAPGLAAGDLLL